MYMTRLGFEILTYQNNRTMNKETKQQNSIDTQMGYDTVLATVDYSKKENQIGCGYCAKEKACTMRDPKINKAKQGCKEWKHWQDSSGY